MTSALGFIELAQEEIKNDDYDNLNENLEHVLKACRRLNDEVNQFLVFFDQQKPANNSRKSDQLIIQHLLSLLKEAVEYYGIEDTESTPYGMRVHSAMRSYKERTTCIIDESQGENFVMKNYKN